MSKIIASLGLVLILAITSQATAMGCPKFDSKLSSEQISLAICKNISTRYAQDTALAVNILWDIERGAVSHATMSGIPAPQVVPGIDDVDETNIELLAREFLTQNLCELRIDPATLVKSFCNSSSSDSRGRVTVVVFNQCYNGLPVVGTLVSVQCIGNVLREVSNTSLAYLDCSTKPRITVGQALQRLESLEKARFEKGDSPQPVRSIGLASSILYDDYYDIRDSAGTVVPYANRLVAAQLVVFPRMVGKKLTSILSWDIYLGIGLRGSEVPFQRFKVDAINGELMERQGLGGGCVVPEYHPLIGCGTPVTRDGK